MRAFVVDAFTDTAFRGNPAGVVQVDAPADAVWMQSVAAELKHSETAFVSPRPGGYDLRWFTPLVEVDLCGHATLAAAHVLATGSGDPGPFAFETRSGTLTARVLSDGAVTLDFPARAVSPVRAPDGLDAALAVEPLGCYGNGMDLLVEVADARAVASLRPDIALLAEVDCRGVIVTAAGDGSSGAAQGADFVSRFFAPRVGVDEDPVTGSAHCALAPFWSERLGRESLVGAQLSGRGGRVVVRVAGDRVELTGRAVTVIAGELLT
jgi:PhzF family phenazine biosynthesis protein